MAGVWANFSAGRLGAISSASVRRNTFFAKAPSVYFFGPKGDPRFGKPQRFGGSRLSPERPAAAATRFVEANVNARPSRAAASEAKRPGENAPSPRSWGRAVASPFLNRTLLRH